MSQFVIDEETLTAIADAIRENAPNSCEGNMTPQEMAAFIPDVRSEAYQEAYDEIDGEVSTQADLIAQIKEKANALPELVTLPRAEGVSNFTEEEYAIYGSTLTAIADAMRDQAPDHIGDGRLSPEDMAERMVHVHENGYDYGYNDGYEYGYDDGYYDGAADVYYPLRMQSFRSPEYDSNYDDLYFYTDIYRSEEYGLDDFFDWEVTSSSQSCTFSLINYSERWVKVFVYFYCERYNMEPFMDYASLLIEPGGTGEISREISTFESLGDDEGWYDSDVVGVRFI